jgi:type IV pilus assembly protein PilX
MKNFKFKQKQQGVALAVGMILLLIISIIGVTSMKSAILQDKMAGGLKNRELADAAALSLLVEAEKFIYDYHLNSNSVVLGVGSQYIVEPRSDISKSFRANRDLSSGYELIGNSINTELGGVLKLEPRFIIEATHELAISSTGSTPFGQTQASYNDGGSAGDASSGGSDVNSKLYTFRIISKATDTTGHVFSAFESVMTVKTR